MSRQKFMKHTAVLTIAIALLASMAVKSWASIVDFEDVAITSGTLTNETDIVSGGFLFDTSTNHSHLVNDSASPNFSANGTTFFVFDNFAGSSFLTMSSVSGSLFNFYSADFSEGWVLEMASSLRVQGFSVGGLLSQSVTLDGINDGVGSLIDFQTEVFDWMNLSSVTFTATGGVGDWYVGIDNINAAPVPEPSTFLLLGGGLAGIAIFARRRKK